MSPLPGHHEKRKFIRDFAEPPRTLLCGSLQWQAVNTHGAAQYNCWSPSREGAANSIISSLEPLFLPSLGVQSTLYEIGWVEWEIMCVSSSSTKHYHCHNTEPKAPLSCETQFAGEWIFCGRSFSAWACKNKCWIRRLHVIPHGIIIAQKNITSNVLANFESTLYFSSGRRRRTHD